MIFKPEDLLQHKILYSPSRDQVFHALYTWYDHSYIVLDGEHHYEDGVFDLIEIGDM